MADKEDETSPAATEATPNEAGTEASPAETAPVDEASVESLIEQFKTQVQRPEPTADEQTGDAADESVQEIPDAETDPDPRDVELRETRQQLEQTQAALDYQRAAQQELADLNDIVGKIAAEIGDKASELPPDFIELQMLAAYASDPELKAAWDSRYSDAQSLFRADRAVKALIKRISETIKALPDKEATADHAAVVHAVRSASLAAPGTREPDVANMNDAEFREYQKKFGYVTSG